jgi:AraC-like DNA-binding protein
MTKDSLRDARKSVPAPAAYLKALLRRFAPTTELRAKLLDGTDIDDVQLNNPAAEVTLFTFVTFSENLCRVVGETWPLDALPAWSTAMQGALEVAVRSAPTIGEGIDILARYGHVRGPHLVLQSKRDKAKTRVTLGCGVAMSEAARRATIETAVLSARAMLDQILEDAMSQAEYHFPWKPPKYATRMRDTLGGTVKFGQSDCAFLLPNVLCGRMSPYADPALFASAFAELEHAARRIQGEDMLTIRVERLLKRRRTDRLSEDEAAKELGLSRRTLVRRLSERGTTFRALLDANLKERAHHMLADGKLSRDEMSEALGFEDPTSFSRACRRWFKKEN